jgi:redox-sensitive bicupin YhaK (pirin superfamily)
MLGDPAQMSGAGAAQSVASEAGDDHVVAAPILGGGLTSNETLSCHPIHQARKAALGDENPAGQIDHAQTAGLGFAELYKDVVENDGQADLVQFFPQNRHYAVMCLQEGSPGRQLWSGRAGFHADIIGECCFCNYCYAAVIRKGSMPAVTVSDVLSLPVVIPNPGDNERPVRSVTTAQNGLEGEGFPVRRAFSGVPLDQLDPFIHLDQMGEVEYAPGEPKGTPWHPHRGFETVTYMIDGTFEHQDSQGGGGTITNGDTQWMTAGSGLLHIEKPPETLVMSGGLFHGFQLWVNLPSKDKFLAPRYQDLRAAEVALVRSPDGGSLLRIIAGEIGGHQGPGSTHTPITMVHATVSPGAQLRLPWRADFNSLVYVLSGKGSFGIQRRPAEKGQLVVFGSGDQITMAADVVQESRSPELEVLILGGKPIGEPVAWYGPFVMNTRTELIQAYEDFQAGRLGVIPVHGG